MENIVKDYQGFKRDTDLAVEKIRTGAMTMAQGAVELGYQLKIARDTGVLQESGYSTMGEFAREEYGLRPDQTTRYIQLNDKYSENGYSRRLQEKYTGIGKTILMEMLTLPDIISEEITESFSKEDVRTLNSEIKEENMITDLEVMMEETDQKQEELPSILEKTVYQLGKDYPEVYIELFGAFEIDDSQGAAEILAPNEEKIYSLRIPGTGRMLLSLKLSEQEIRLINVRSQEKEDFIWRQLERALRNLMDFTKTAKESWEQQYGEKLPKKEHPEDKPEKRPAKVQKAKKPEKKKPDPVEKADNSVDKCQKTAVEEKEEPCTESTLPKPDFQTSESQPENTEKSQETALPEPEPQIPGQDSIENHPEYMPKHAEPEEQPESNLKPELQEDHFGEVNEMVPEEPAIAPAQFESEPPAAEPKTRKEYIDTLTAYGTAEYIARAMRQFANKTYNTLLDPVFWNEWLNGKVDHNGRPWED